MQLSGTLWQVSMNRVCEVAIDNGATRDTLVVAAAAMGRLYWPHIVQFSDEHGNATRARCAV